MKRSTDRLLTTHTGMLQRPADLIDMVRAPDSHAVEALGGMLRAAVSDVVRRQVDVGINSVNDGEYGKRSYAGYVPDRMSGFGPPAQTQAVSNPVRRDFPEFFMRLQSEPRPDPPLACIGPVGWTHFDELKRDIENLRQAALAARPVEVFMTSVSPGSISAVFPNEYYGSRQGYVEALGALMREEYEAIHAAGFQLQIACPDLAMGRALRFADLSTEEFREVIRLNVEVLNEATKNIPPDDMGIHLCWGAVEAPHHEDVPLREIVDIVLQARPAALNLTAANPRHSHEWKVWQEIKLPPGKLLIPGVIDTTTNFVEHPEVVADRLIQFAGVVGRENVVAGTDCGFAPGGISGRVDERVSWAKLRSLVEGAELASAQLWRT